MAEAQTGSRRAGDTLTHSDGRTHTRVRARAQGQTMLRESKGVYTYGQDAVVTSGGYYVVRDGAVTQTCSMKRKKKHSGNFENLSGDRGAGEDGGPRRVHG